MTGGKRLQRFEALGYSEALLGQFHDDFWKSQQPSIDAFLESREDHLDLGKHIIAAFLIPNEVKSALRPEDLSVADDMDKSENGKQKPDEHWYRYLFHRMGPTKENFRESLKRISVITFNYDRSFEYYFFETVKSAYGVGDEEAADLVEGFGVIHFYGLLGKTHFSGTGKDRRGYEAHFDENSIRTAASMIRIISAEDDRAEEQQIAHRLIEKAERICFVGFGYDVTNLTRLNVHNLFSVPRDGQVLGTGYRVEDDVRKRAQPLLTYVREDMGVMMRPVIGDITWPTLKFLKANTVLG